MTKEDIIKQFEKETNNTFNCNECKYLKNCTSYPFCLTNVILKDWLFNKIIELDK